jgi:4-coumarate--CoA ligase
MLRSFHALKKCAPQMTQYLKYRAFSVLSSTRSMPEVLGDSGALKRQSVPRFLLKDFLKDDVRSKTAIYDGTNRISKTYEEVYKDCYSVAYNLRYTHNIKANNVVGLMAPNHINYLSAWLGISLTGAASTTINPIYTAEEVEFQLRQTEARAIVAHSMCLPVVKPVAEKLGIDVFCLDSDASESDGVLSWNALMDKPLGSIQPSDFVVDPDSIMTIPFSSGTTGVPKGVLLSHHNIVTNILQSMPDEGENMSPKPWRPEGSKVLVPLPFFHIYGMVAGMCVPLIAQAQMIFMQQFDLIRFLEIIQERKVDYTYIVPPIILALAKHPIVDNYDISSLKVVMSAAAPLGPELQQVAAERLNIFVKQGWGMTEISPIGITTPIPEGNPAQWDVPMEVKKILGKAGKLVPNTYAKICDIDSGAELEHTQEGELLIKGPQVMQGYLKNPEATSNTITADGWMKTGVSKLIAYTSLFCPEVRLKTEGLPSLASSSSLSLSLSCFSPLIACICL